MCVCVSTYQYQSLENCLVAESFRKMSKGGVCFSVIFAARVSSNLKFILHKSCIGIGIEIGIGIGIQPSKSYKT